jgi:hypothetical protein
MLVAVCTLQAHLSSCIIIVSISSSRRIHVVSISKKVGGVNKNLELSSMRVAESVGSGGVMSAEGCGRDIIGVDVIVLED